MCVRGALLALQGFTQEEVCLVGGQRSLVRFDIFQEPPNFAW